jgi:hypothetical protein
MFWAFYRKKEALAKVPPIRAMDASPLAFGDLNFAEDAFFGTKITAKKGKKPGNRQSSIF